MVRTVFFLSAVNMTVLNFALSSLVRTSLLASIQSDELSGVR